MCNKKHFVEKKMYKKFCKKIRPIEKLFKKCQQKIVRDILTRDI